MRWEDERYVRLYTRDTPEWAMMSWQARGLFSLLMRIVDRAGILRLGRAGVRGLAMLLRAPDEQVQVALEEWCADGCVRLQGDVLVIPNFVEAQEANQSDAARKRTERERARDKANAESELSQPIETKELSRAVTSSHTASQAVTPSRAVPSVPSQVADAGAPRPEFRGIATVEEAAEVIAKPRRQRKPKEEKSADARHAPLREAMKAVYREERRADLGWEGKEGGILSGLLAANPTLTVEAGAAAWRRALRNSAYPTVSTVAEFRQHLAHFLGAGPPSRAGGARVTEADKDWDGYEPKRTEDGQVDWEAA